MKRVQHPKRNTTLTRHHILAKSRGGKSSPSNLLKLWADRHAAWHNCFGHRTIGEILFNFHLCYSLRNPVKWKLVFGNKSYDDCMALLLRVSLFKHNLKRRT